MPLELGPVSCSHGIRRLGTRRLPQCGTCPVSIIDGRHLDAPNMHISPTPSLHGPTYRQPAMWALREHRLAGVTTGASDSAT